VRLAVEVLAAVNRPLAAGGCPGATPWRTAADEASLSDKRIESWRNAGLQVSPRPRVALPGQAAVLDLGGERNGDLVVKSPVALPLHLNQPCASAAAFPIPKWAFSATVDRVWLDVDWSTKAEATYEKNPRGTAARVTTA